MGFPPFLTKNPNPNLNFLKISIQIFGLRKTPTLEKKKKKKKNLNFWGFFFIPKKPLWGPPHGFPPPKIPPLKG